MAKLPSFAAATCATGTVIRSSSTRAAP